MKRLLQFTFAGMFLLLFTACGTGSESIDITLDDVLSAANERREGIIQPSEDEILQLIARCPAPYREGVDINYLATANDEPPSEITAKTAKYDARLFFNLLREGYGAYAYFGGDEVFLPLLDEILEYLSAQEAWTPHNLTSLLYNRLSEVITDNHFFIGANWWTAGASYQFFAGGTPFDRTENGFRRRGGRRYVAEVPGHDIENIFRLAVNEEGEFFYTPVIVIPYDYRWRATRDLEIILDNGRTETVELFNSQHEDFWFDFEDSSLRFEGDIPIVTVRRMGGYGFTEDAERFLSTAEGLRDEPVIIVDIRSNWNWPGDPLLSTQWLYRLLGEIVPKNYVEIYSGANAILPEELGKYSPYISLGYHHTIINYYDRTIQNDRLIILLVNRGTVSAAEIFTDQMFNIENTLVIGQNTYGRMLTDFPSAGFELPNSAIPIAFGSTVRLHPERHFSEGVGFAPDVWAVGDALAAALAMLNN